MRYMTNFLRWILLGYSLLLFTSAYAAPSDDLGILLNSIHTMRANFTQTVYDNHGKSVQQSFGQMALERPGKFRWQVTKPIPQLIIANQERLWIYDPDLEQVTVRTLKHAAGEAPALLLSHVNNVLGNDFNVKTMQKNTPSWQWYELIPKSPDSMFASIQMGFMNKQINQMHLKDHLGHTTTIQYKNIETNVNLNASLFTFNKPKNVDMIDETRKK